MFSDKNTPSLYYKYCNKPDMYSDYSSFFQLEFDSMNTLRHIMEENGEKALYSQLFPYYYSTGTTANGQPFICMEHIVGITLEEILRNKNNSSMPYRLLSHRQIMHIYDQLHNALYWLYQAGMMQFDLSPQNIFITNTYFDIKLIDFTNCYHFNKPTQYYKKIDYRITSELPLSIQLRNTCALLFTRLFFNGKENYYEFFASQNTNKVRENRNFFEKYYPQLLNCIFYPDSEKYTTSDINFFVPFEEWYKQLQKLLCTY